MALFFNDFDTSLFQTKIKASPIKMYKSVHTGEKIQIGGLKDGFSIVANQLLTEDVVKKPATAPTATGITMEIINFKLLLIIKAI